MTMNYNVTGDARKEMVGIISNELGIKAVYTRMPECAYEIGELKVTKTGELIWDERTNAETIAKVTAALAAAGFTAEDAEEEQAEETEPEETAADEAEGLSISFPADGFTDTALENLHALIASKRTLIKKSLQADRTEVTAEEGKITFAWWDSLPRTDQVTAYTAFLAALVKMAKEAKRVTAVERDVESEKYAFRIFLLRLGFNGADHKAVRAILMEHLSGHAAFKNKEAADAFYAAQKAKKAAEKEADDEISE